MRPKSGVFQGKQILSVEMRLQKQNPAVLRRSAGAPFGCRLLTLCSNFTQDYEYQRVLPDNCDMNVSERRGISLEDAYRHLATEAELAELDRLSDCRKWLLRHVVYQVGAPAHERERAGRYFHLMKALAQRVLEKLCSGEMAATAIVLPLKADSCRTTISCEVWESLEIDFLEDTASGGDLRLIQIRVLVAGETSDAEPPADDVHRLPPSSTPNGYVHLSEDDEILIIGLLTMILTGEIQQSIMRQLVDAYPSGKRLKTKAVLEKAGSNANSIAKAFNGSRYWTFLKQVIRQEKGYCWLEI
jgi:hypothetical protein